MLKENYKKAIIKSVLSGSATATAWALCTIFEMGALTVEAFLSPSLYAELPNASSFFNDFAKVKKKAKFKEITIRQSLRRLEKHGFVERKSSKYEITAKGKIFLENILKERKDSAQSWDRKYRVVIFDIPERMRLTRNWLRSELCSLGYKKLQQSVFIGKKPLPEDIITEIKRNKIGNCVNYLLVDKVYKNII
jgi:CRISPR-associated endonuclease Cas2